VQRSVEEGIEEEPRNELDALERARQLGPTTQDAPEALVEE
jgi:hypothetical protein